MNIPCRVKALKYLRYRDLEMSDGDTAEVTLLAEKTSKMRYRLLKVEASNRSSQTFIEEALKNAVARGDFEVV